MVGPRDRANRAILTHTPRAGAVATRRRGSFYHAGDQRMLHFEKGGKSREIPTRQKVRAPDGEMAHARLSHRLSNKRVARDRRGRRRTDQTR